MIFKKHMLISALSLFLFSCATPTPIQEFQVVQAEQRSITVTGIGEVKVAPDLAEVVFSVYTANQDLIAAKQENDEISRNVLEAIRSYEIDENDIKTDYLNIFSETSESTPQIYRYGVKNGFKVTVRDLSILEALITDVLKAGGNRIAGVYFRVSDLETQQEKAREMAIKSAKEKAIKMAGELGQEIDVPLTITESPVIYPYGATSFLALGRADYNSYNFEEFNVMAFGEITIKASVSIEFSLK